MATNRQVATQAASQTTSSPIILGARAESFFSWLEAQTSPELAQSALLTATSGSRGGDSQPVLARAEQLLAQLTAATPGKSPASGGTAGAVVGKSSGVWLPSGCLDRFRPLRAQAKAGTIRGEIVMYGDSTWWGQATSVTDPTTGAGRYPLPQKLRALAIAAGFPDGGAGIFGTRGGLGTLGADNLTVEVGKVGTWGEGFYSPIRQYSYKNLSNAVGDSVTVQFKTPANGSVRINHTVQTPANGAAWSYQVDGQAAVPVSAQTATRKTKTRTVTGLSAGTHTLTIALTTAGAAASGDEWCFEALGPSGLVFQNYSISGSSAKGRFDISTSGYAQEAFGLGYYEDAAMTTPNTPFLVNNGRAGTPRNPILAGFGLGINDEQAAIATTADAVAAAALLSAGVGAFAESIREVCDGFVAIPHLAWAQTNPQYVGTFRNALMSTALSYGLAVLDMQAPVGGRTGYAAYGQGVHLNPAGYDAQAQFMFDNLINA